MCIYIYIYIYRERERHDLIYMYIYITMILYMCVYIYIVVIIYVCVYIYIVVIISVCIYIYIHTQICFYICTQSYILNTWLCINLFINMFIVLYWAIDNATHISKLNKFLENYWLHWFQLVVSLFFFFLYV